MIVRGSFPKEKGLHLGGVFRKAQDGLRVPDPKRYMRNAHVELEDQDGLPLWRN